VILDDRELERFAHEGDYARTTEGGGEPLSLDEQDLWSDQWLVAQFLDWLDGGDPMATDVTSNLQSVALVEAAIRSSETGAPVQVQELLAETRRNVDI